MGVGSDFVALVQGSGEKTTLRITEARGLDRSVATVISPSGAKVAPKDVFELSKWVQAKRPSLYFWAPASQLTTAQIASVVREARSSGLQLAGDPSREVWDVLIGWDGSQWTMQKTGVRGADSLGPMLTAALLQRKVPKDAVVWLNLPPPADLSGQLTMNDPRSAAQSAANEAGATYVLAGTVMAGEPAYAWYNRGELIAGRRTPAGYGNGCSPDSPYPIRTDWVSPMGVDGAPSLRQLAVNLARLNGWLQLAQSGAAGDSDYPYHLALRREADQAMAEDKAQSRQGDVYQMMLQARGDTRTDPRWIYVLAIDCQGKGDLMFPRQAGGNRYPLQDGRLDRILLPGAKFRVTPPFGTDTYVLLSTSTELSNPDVLSFGSVVRGGQRGTGSALEMLLTSTSAGTRGSAAEVPMDWGVEYLQLHSQPAKAAGDKPQMSTLRMFGQAKPE